VEGHGVITPKIANAVIVVVTVVWVCSFVVSILVPEYRADPQINVIFMGIVGGSLALKARKPNTDDKH
jgi:hypothetical protein